MAAITATTATTTVAEATTTSSSPESFRADGRLAHEAASARIAELFREQACLVLRICRSMLRDRVEAEDAAQQTFLSAYASMLAGRGPREEVAWIATIARNECRARIRARMYEPLVELDEDGPVAGDDVQAIAIRRSEVEALRRGLVDLPAQQRQALVLREFAGLSYEELAESLSVSLASVESLLFRARRGLRSRLEPAFAGINGALSVPLVFRDWLLRLASGGGGESVGAAAKIASLPVAAKIAAAAASAGLVAGSAVGIEVRSEHTPARHPAVRAVKRPVRAPAPRPQSASEARVASPPPAAPATVLVAARHVAPRAHAVVPRRPVVHIHRGHSRGGDAVRFIVPPVSHRGRGDGHQGHDSDGGEHGFPHGRGDDPQTPPVVAPPAVPPTTGGHGGDDNGDGGQGGNDGGGGQTVVAVATGQGGHGDGGGDSVDGGGDQGGSGSGGGSHGDNGADSHGGKDDSGKPQD